MEFLSGSSLLEDQQCALIVGALEVETSFNPMSDTKSENQIADLSDGPLTFLLRR